MENETVHARDLIRLELERRKKIYPSYSLRRFATYLEMPVSTLSAILNDETNPTKTSLLNFAKKLNWSADVLQNQIRISAEERSRKQLLQNYRQVVDPDKEMLESLIPFSVLTLARTNKFEASGERLAKALGCQLAQAEAALHYLIEKKFVVVEDGILKAKTVTIIDNEDSRHLVKKFVSRWMEFGADQFASSNGEGTNSFLFQIVAPKEKVFEVGAKFEEFGRSIRRKFPIEGASGELFSVGAVIFPSAPRRF